MFTEYSVELWAYAVSGYGLLEKDSEDFQTATETFVFHLMQEEG